MPVYMDRHYVEGATRHAIADAHQKDLALQDKYHVKFLTYWFDEMRCTAFCLIEAPNRETIERAHNEAHGLVDQWSGKPLPLSDLGEVTPKGFEHAIRV